MDSGFELYVTYVFSSTGKNRQVVLAYLQDEVFGYVQSFSDDKSLVKCSSSTIDSLFTFFDEGNSRYFSAKDDFSKFAIMDFVRLNVETGVANRDLTNKLNRAIGLCEQTV